MVVLLLLACGSKEEQVDVEPTVETTDVSTTDAPTEPGPSTPTGSTGSTATTGDTAPELDCSVRPTPGPVVGLQLPDSEDFAFEEDKIIAWEAGFLVKQAYPPSVTEPWTPTQNGDSSSLRRLSDGRVVYANINTASVNIVEPDGSQTILFSPTNYAKGIDIDQQDRVWLVDLGALRRIDPNSGTAETFWPQIPSGINGVSFSADYSELYMADYENIYALPVDANGDPSGPPRVHLSYPSAETLGMGVDACNNIYVCFRDKLVRFYDPAQPPEVIAEAPGGWLTNMQWGSGVGGFDDESVYIVNRYESPPYLEVHVGIPEKPR